MLALRAGGPPAVPAPRLLTDARWSLAEIARAYYATRHRSDHAALRDLARERYPSLRAVSDAALATRFRRLAGARLRQRDADPRRAQRVADLWAILGPAYSARRREAHSKGPWLDRSIGSRRATLAGILDAPEMQARLVAQFGAFPPLDAVERLCRERLGQADAWDEWRPHVQALLGFRAEYAGQVLSCDATGVPVQIAHSRGGGVDYERRWLHVCVDIASGYMLTAEHAGASEAPGWSDALLAWLWSLGYAPEALICDQVSQLFDCLRYLAPGRDLTAPTGVLAWLAAGARPYVHQQARPTGGAHVESAVRVAKDTARRLTVKRAISAELSGAGLTRATRFSSEIEWRATYEQLAGAVNARAFRGADTRASLWSLGADARAARALAPGLHDEVTAAGGRPLPKPLSRWETVVARARVDALDAGRLRARDASGRAIAADLDAASVETLRAAAAPADLTVLSFPGGLRAGDDPDLLRVVAIQPGEWCGQPRYHTLTARCARVDAYCQDLRLPLLGEYRARPETVEDARKRHADALARQWGGIAGALREATNDAPVDRGGAPAAGPVAEG